MPDVTSPSARLELPIRGHAALPQAKHPRPSRRPGVAKSHSRPSEVRDPVTPNAVMLEKQAIGQLLRGSLHHKWRLVHSRIDNLTRQERRGHAHIAQLYWTTVA